jgi:hypothetical protein
MMNDYLFTLPDEVSRDRSHHELSTVSVVVGGWIMDVKQFQSRVRLSARRPNRSVRSALPSGPGPVAAGINHRKAQSGGIQTLVRGKPFHCVRWVAKQPRSFFPNSKHPRWTSVCLRTCADSSEIKKHRGVELNRSFRKKLSWYMVQRKRIHAHTQCGSLLRSFHICGRASTAWNSIRSSLLDDFAPLLKVLARILMKSWLLVKEVRSLPTSVDRTWKNLQDTLDGTRKCCQMASPWLGYTERNI